MIITCLVREHTNFLQYGADRSTSLSPTGEGNNTVTAHVVTTSHDGTASTKFEHILRGSSIKTRCEPVCSVDYSSQSTHTKALCA